MGSIVALHLYSIMLEKLFGLDALQQFTCTILIFLEQVAAPRNLRGRRSGINSDAQEAMSFR